MVLGLQENSIGPEQGTEKPIGSNMELQASQGAPTLDLHRKQCPLG